MTAFVSNNPETSGEQTSPEAVEGPQRDAGGSVEGRVGKGNVRGVDELACVHCGLVERDDDEQVPSTIKSIEKGNSI